MFFDCTVLPDRKEPELGSSNQEVSLSVSRFLSNSFCYFLTFSALSQDDKGQLVLFGSTTVFFPGMMWSLICCFSNWPNPQKFAHYLLKLIVFLGVYHVYWLEYLWCQFVSVTPSWLADWPYKTSSQEPSIIYPLIVSTCSPFCLWGRWRWGELSTKFSKRVGVWQELDF